MVPTPYGTECGVVIVNDDEVSITHYPPTGLSVVWSHSTMVGWSMVTTPYGAE